MCSGSVLSSTSSSERNTRSCARSASSSARHETSTADPSPRARSRLPGRALARTPTESLLRYTLCLGYPTDLVLLLKTIHAARRVHQFLMTGEERMARRTDLHTHVAFVSRA